MKKFFIGICFSIFLTGCASLKTEYAMMHGLVVNGSNIPVPDVEVYMEEKLAGRSNTNGFFEIEVPLKSEVSFTTKKSGWEIKDFKENFVDSTKLYVYQIRSLELVYAEIEKYLLGNDFYAASPLINDLENKYGDKKTADFLRSVIAYKRGEYETADKLFVESQVEKDSNIFMKKFHEKIGGALWNLSK